jgi:hypothetical protein
MPEKDNFEERGMLCAVSYYKALIFYALAEKHLKENDLISTIITSYYSIFHLSVSRIKIHEGFIFDEEKELCDRNSPDKSKITHEKVMRIINQLVEQKKIDKKYYDCLIELNDLRNYVNYEPRLIKKEKYTFDTCSKKDNLLNFQKHMIKLRECFFLYVDSLTQIKEKRPFDFNRVYWKQFIFDFYVGEMKLITKSVALSAKKLHKEIDYYYEQRI